MKTRNLQHLKPPIIFKHCSCKFFHTSDISGMKLWSSTISMWLIIWSYIKLTPAIYLFSAKLTSSLLGNSKSLNQQRIEQFPKTSKKKFSWSANNEESSLVAVENKDEDYAPIHLDQEIDKLKQKAQSLFENIQRHVQQLFRLNLDQEEKKKKVLILMSDTGGGHRASAQAIEQALHVQFPSKFTVEIMDIWTDHGAWPYNQFVPAYRYVAKRPLLWKGFFVYGNFPITRKIQELLSWHACALSFQQAIEHANPDLIVSVHPLCQYIPLYVVEKMNARRQEKSLPRIPFVTVVTDLGGGHKTWFDPRVDACYVPSQAMANLAQYCGVAPRKIIMKGLPVRPAFWSSCPPDRGISSWDSSAEGERARDREKARVRGRLGLQPEARTVLVMGGGDGVGDLHSLATSLYTTLANSSTSSTSTSKRQRQVVVICGHNQALRHSLAHSLCTPCTPSSASQGVRCSVCSAAVLGFVSDVDQYMLASDVLVTKAGPGTIAEAMICGLPIVLSSFLPGQEAGNVPYVVNGGFGVYTGPHPQKIADTVSEWLGDEAKLRQMSRQARQLAHPQATISIARDIGESLLQGQGQLVCREYIKS